MIPVEIARLDKAIDLLENNHDEELDADGLYSYATSLLCQIYDRLVANGNAEIKESK